jgi:hypothetical protein
MLSVLSPPVVPAVRILQEAVLKEQGHELVRFTSSRDLDFNNPESEVNKYLWSSDELGNLARNIHPSLSRLCSKFSSAAVKGCITSCSACLHSRIAKFGLGVVSCDGVIVGVASWRSLQVKPSTILKALARDKLADILVEYRDKDLTVLFRESDRSIFAVRSILSTGWTLERAEGYVNEQQEVTLGSFSKWVISDWSSALIQAKSGVRRRTA